MTPEMTCEDCICTNCEHYGVIDLDSAVGKMLGFNSENFTEGSYLWVDKAEKNDTETVWLCSITSKKTGAFSQLMKNINLFGWHMVVANPSYPMKKILVNKGYINTTEKTKYGFIDVWKRS